ncbi:MAG TPA: NAD-dependent epimerase/dehydratase family protein [Actinophytocola sp.]|uniref:NAD-dependent epimerase/dehydratase family protein n=1 Tax=Actinophytocola sp. TaxID=1872138 RepID=UPI002DB718D9|nr:NAD-dependent epimerase/dehydratase family protein [Actinophytocola sp.]HEU5470428.1 NAD-dependent epimerase/dehydratase family protein [Actinophytocola sp.]
MDLVDRHVMVVGGAGAIGSHVVDQLVESGVRRVRVVDDLSRGLVTNLATALARAPQRVELIEADIRDAARMHKLCAGMDIVFHLAATKITRCAEQPREALEVLVDGTFNLVEAAAATGVRRFVLSSTASVYGLAETFPTTERHHPYNNDTLYGAGKAFNEGLLRAFHATHGLDYVALRYFNVYGPRMDAHGKYTEVLIRWMERIATGQPPLIHGDGKQSFDFVHISDVARANLLAARSDRTDRVYNIASGEETSLLDLARTLLEEMGVPDTLEFGPERTVSSVTRRLADISAAERDLHWTPTIDLRTGLADLIAWWRTLP